MRVAVSGTHRSGKSTLIEELSSRLRTYKVIDEPYHSMLEEGYEFNQPPSLEDFEAQLERSLEDLGGDTENALFDRCPIDLLAYIAVHSDSATFDLEEWLPRVRAAARTLDLVLFVPIEARDRIAFTRGDDADDSREPVDEKLRELLVEDSLDLGLEVLEVEGNVEQRVELALGGIR